MFQVRAFLTNFYLACFDLAITAIVYFSLLNLELEWAGRKVNWQTAFAPAQLSALGSILAVWFALLLNFRMYHSRRMNTVFADLSILAKVALVSLVILEALARLLPALQPTALFLALFVGVNVIVLGTARVGVRLLLRELRRRGYNTKNLVVVAAPELGDRISKKFAQRDHYGYRILRRLEYPNQGGEAARQLLEAFRQTVRVAHVDDVILALPAEARRLTAQLVEECENRGINARLVPDLFPIIQTDTQVYDLDGIPLLNVHLYPTEFLGYVVLKRVFDFVVSLAVMILLSPLLLTLGLLIKLTSRGPVFFVQERVGLNGKKFRMLKFRTMHVQAAPDSKIHWTTPNDPHVTPVGRWLRRSNLDELPQFLNVLKGDMSLVGPRPERPFFIERFRQEVPDYMLRHYVKCGITGWAQVNGWRGDTSIPERVAHDLYYLRNWGLGLDFKILLLTLTRGFFHRNAY